MKDEFTLSLTNNIVMTFSGRAHSGKDTAAAFCRTYIESAYKNKVFSLAFADYLKILCSRNFGYDENDKEATRPIVQNFGEEVKFFDQSFWVDTVYHTIDVLRKKYDVFIIPDARFTYELQPRTYMLSYPIFNIFVDRDVEDTESTLHNSEDMAKNPDLSKFHYHIDNNGSLEDLAKRCVEIVDDIFMNADRVLLEARGIDYEGVM